jgi:TPR repeat protein
MWFPSRKSFLWLAIFMVAGLSLFAQTTPTDSPCPAGLAIPNVKGQSGVMPPRPIQIAEPDLRNAPPDALAPVVYFVIPLSGSPCDIRLFGSNHEEVRQRVLEAVSKFRFAPAQIQGKPIATRASIAIQLKRPGENAPMPHPGVEQAKRILTGNNAAQKPAALQQLEVWSKEGIVPATGFLAWMVYNGAGLPKDLARARTLAQSAAESGDAFGSLTLGLMALRADGMPANDALAAKNLETAARANIVAAQELTAQCYRTGKGVAADSQRAALYFELCAAMGNPRCALSLAQLQAVQQSSQVQALTWATVALRRNQQEAAPLIAQLEKALPPAGQQAAAKLAEALLLTNPPR